MDAAEHFATVLFTVISALRRYINDICSFECNDSIVWIARKLGTHINVSLRMNSNHALIR